MTVKIYAFADEADKSLDGQINALLRNGLAGVELRNVDGQNTSKMTLETVREIKKKLDDNGLNVYAIGSPLGKITIQDDFAPHMEDFKHTIEMAHILGAENIRMFSFFLPKEEDPALYRNAVMDRLGQFVENADGVTLCHENEKGIYGDVVDRCLDILQTYPQIKAVFDPANFVQCQQETLSAWQSLKNYTRYIHIKDSLPDGTVVKAGDGAGNIPYIVKDYLEMGGTCMTLEPHLTVFDGLAALEREGDTTKIQHAYSDANTAFDVACNALKEILCK